MFEAASEARTFITGGNATVTLRSTKTGGHLTFKVAVPKHAAPGDGRRSRGGPGGRHPQWKVDDIFG